MPDYGTPCPVANGNIRHPDRSSNPISLSSLSDVATGLHEAEQDAGSVRVLLLASDPDVGQLIQRELRNRGVSVYVLQRRLDDDLTVCIRSEHPLLLIIDPSLEIDTVAWCETARATDPMLSVLLLDGPTDVPVADTLMAHDARDWLRSQQPDTLAFVLAREIAFAKTRRSLAQREQETRLLQAQQRVLLRDMGVAIAMVSDGVVIEANEPFAQLVGETDPEALPLLDLVDPAHQTEVRDTLAALLKDKLPSAELTLQFSGSSRPLRVALRRLERDGEPCIELVGTPSRERSEPQLGVRARLIAEANHAAHDGSTDVLAILEIRILETEALEAELGFSEFGELLEACEHFLRSLLDGDDRLYHIAPGRKIVLYRRATTRRLKSTADEWMSSLTDTIFRTQTHQMHLRMAAVGFANELHEDAGVCLGRTARQFAESPPEAGEVVLLESDDADLKRRKSELAWRKRIEAGLRDGGFSLSYMPILKLDDTEEQQYDALLRLSSKDGKEFQARDFIQVAERTGLIVDLDRCVVDIAIDLLMQRRREQGAPMRLFVKLSEQTVAQPQAFLHWLRVRLVGKPDAYRQIVFNLQESFLQNRLDQAIELCDGIRHFGAGISIDYFGTDERSGELLDELLPDFVKLHASFTQAVSQPGASQNQMRTIIDKARDERVEVIAQRVEDAETMAALWQMGVGYVQGFHIKGPDPSGLE